MWWIILKVSYEFEQGEMNEVELSIRIILWIGIWGFGWSINLKINLRLSFGLGLGDMTDCGSWCKLRDFTKGTLNH